MQAVVPTAVSIGGVVTHLHAVERPEARSLPSISSLVITSACYALIGYALARLRWWAGMPCLLFLALTLSATFERLDDYQARGPLPSAFTRTLSRVPQCGDDRSRSDHCLWHANATPAPGQPPIAQPETPAALHEGWRWASAYEYEEVSSPPCEDLSWSVNRQHERVEAS
jgi:hypothetical protein